MSNFSPEMQSCIDECLRRYQTCLGMAMSHCLEAGGKHVAAGHLRTMMACAEMCHTLAHLMLIGTDHHSTPARSAPRTARPVRNPASRWAAWRLVSSSALDASIAAARWRPRRTVHLVEVVRPWALRRMDRRSAKRKGMF